MNYLLSLGCSWTDPNYFSFQHPDLDCSWDKWPNHIAQALNVPVVNKGRSGSSNQYAFKELLNAVLSDNPPSHIIWQLTDWSRIQLADRRLMPCKRLDACVYDGIHRKQSAEYLMGLHSIPLALDGPIPIINNTLYYIQKAIILCRRLDIVLHIFQSDVSIWPFEENYFRSYLKELEKDNPTVYKIYYDMIDGRLENLFLTQKLIKSVLDLQLFKHIDSLTPSEVYGWPLWLEFGGKRILANSSISEEDTHPDAQGQKNIADGILKWIE